MGWWFRKTIIGAGRSKQLSGEGILYFYLRQIIELNPRQAIKVVCVGRYLVHGALRSHSGSSMAKTVWSGPHSLQLSKSFINTRYNKDFSRGNSGLLTPCQSIPSITETSVWESEWSFPLLTSSTRLRVTGNDTGVSDYPDKALAPSHVNTPWITSYSCALAASQPLTQMLLCRLTSSLAGGQFQMQNNPALRLHIPRGR